MFSCIAIVSMVLYKVKFYFFLWLAVPYSYHVNAYGLNSVVRTCSNNGIYFPTLEENAIL